MIKIEETHQEEEEALQTPMSTSTEDPISHQILKALNEHRKALKKITRRFTKLEEAKLKKPSHIEINDKEDDMEEWDGKDKVEYERNKQFEKLTGETWL